MRICQRWNWWSGRAPTSSERRHSQARGLSQGVLSRNDKISKSPSLKSRVYHWPLPLQPIRDHICQGLPSEFDNVFELLPKNLRWYFHVHISYMHSGIYAMLRKQLEVEIEHLVGSDTLCRGCMNINQSMNPAQDFRAGIWKVNHPTFWSYFC